MEAMEKWVLRKCRHSLLQDLQPKYVLQYLRSKGICNDDQCDLITAGSNEEIQAGLLLDVIERGGFKAYEAFKKCLTADGMYDWLVDDLRKSEEKWEIEQEESKSLRSLLMRGGVPNLSRNFIVRPSRQKQLRLELEKLCRAKEGWVILHGMAGVGKTLMAASVLHDEELFRSFYHHGVFWVKIGKNVFEDTLLLKIHTLCEKLDQSYRNSVPCDIDQATDRLRQIFSQNQFQKSLLVLDDVWHEFVIRHFDFGCRILVTTQDKSIGDVSSLRVSYVEMADGFTWEENKEFFSKSLNISVKELPECVYEIWECTTGSPFVASTVSEKIKMHPKTMADEFSRCLEKLRDSSLMSFQKKSPYTHSCIAQALQISVENLEDMKNRYYDLVIFPENVYVPEQVLSVLWNIETWEVEETMNFFINKSMASKVPNGRKTNYYGIHDLYLIYIRNTQADNLISRHKHLVNEYLRRNDDKYNQLPVDGYILHYLGYHLQEAKMVDKFSQIFLDLNFIITKLRVTGPSDVLGDFYRYRDHIDQKGKFSKEIADFEKFIKSNAYYWSTVGFDILQVALFEPSESEVHKQAKKLCSKKRSSLYFEWGNQRQLPVPNSMMPNHKFRITCATFASDGRHVISVGDDAFVRISDGISGKERVRFVKHNGPIMWCANKFNSKSRVEVILTCSADRTAIIWELNLNALKKISKPLFVDNCHLVFKRHSSSVLTCCLTKRVDKAATLDEEGFVKIWCPVKGIEFCSWKAHKTISERCSCDFSSNGLFLVSAGDSFLCMWKVENNLPEWEYEDSDRLFSCCRFFSDGLKVVATLQDRLAVFHNGMEMFYFYEPTNLPLLCCAISPDNNLVAAGSNNQSVIVWCLEERKIADIFRGQKGCVTSVCFTRTLRNSRNDRKLHSHTVQSEKQNYNLLSLHDESLIITWKVTKTFENMDEILRDKFSVRYDTEGLPHTAVVDINNGIQVRRGFDQKIFAMGSGRYQGLLLIRCCALSHKCDRVVYSTPNGFLKEFDAKTCTTSTLISEHPTPCEILCCVFSSDDSVIVVGDNNGAINILSLGKCTIFAHRHGASVTKIQFFDDDLRILCCSFDNTLSVWDVLSGNFLFCCIGHKDSVVASDISRSDGCLLSASTDTTLRLWNSSTGSNLAVLQGHAVCVRSCAFCSIQGLIASGDDSGKLLIWRYNTQSGSDIVSVNLLREVSAFKDLNSSIWVYDLAFSKDGNHLVTSSDCIQWWDTTELTSDNVKDVFALQCVPVHGSRLTHVFPSPDFRCFITIDDAGILYCFRQVTLENCMAI